MTDDYTRKVRELAVALTEFNEAFDRAEADVVAEAEAAEYDRQRQYDKAPQDRVEPPWSAAPGVIDLGDHPSPERRSDRLNRNTETSGDE